MKKAPRYQATELGAILAAQGRKARWLASQVNLSESQISRIIAGTKTMDAARAKRTADLLGAPLFLLFESRESDDTSLNREGIAA